MAKQKSKMQSQTSSPPRASTGDIEMEDFKSNTLEISEKTESKIKNNSMKL